MLLANRCGYLKQNMIMEKEKCPCCGSENYIECTVAEKCYNCGYEVDYR